MSYLPNIFKNPGLIQLEDGKQTRVEIPALDGNIETIFNIQRQGSSKAWNVLSVGIDSVESIENAKIGTSNRSTLLKVNGNTNELNIKLR